MKHTILRIATRKSPLALWQAYHVRTALQKRHPALTVELLEMTTQGDKILDTPLAKIGGKGLFVKELERGLLDQQADIAVHSMKDVPVEFPAGLHLAVIMQREVPYDAFVTTGDYATPDDLPQGAVVGTSSLRRQMQLLARRPDLQVKTLRGNVGTRLSKLDNGDYAAIILAAAGLKRLEMAHRIRSTLPPDMMLPAIGQGAIGIECRVGDSDTETLIAPLNDPLTEHCVLAERAINQRLGGSCQVPIAGYAQVEGEHMHIRGRVGDPQGQQVLYAETSGHWQQAQALGDKVAADLLAQGAEKILQALQSV